MTPINQELTTISSSPQGTKIWGVCVRGRFLDTLLFRGIVSLNRHETTKEETYAETNEKIEQSKVYHVIIRGNERKKIFLDDDDRQRFIDTLWDKKGERRFLL